MAIAQKILSQTAPAAATLTDSYTVPAATTATISTLFIHNTSAVEDTFVVRIAPAGAVNAAVHQVYGGAAVPGNETIAITTGITLGATDVVRVESTNGTSNFHLYGIEET